MARTGSAQATAEQQADHLTSTTSAPAQAVSPERLNATLRALPSQGWSSGWTGRRDRALLVLSQLAGLSFQAIAELTVADVRIADGVAVIKTPGGVTTLRSVPDGRVCGPCALARWVHVLDLTSIYPSPGVVTAVIARATPVTADSPHLCQGVTDVCETTGALPLLPMIDHWGPLTTRRSVSTSAGAGSRGTDRVDRGPADTSSTVTLFARPERSRGSATDAVVLPIPADRIALSRATSGRTDSRPIPAQPIPVHSISMRSITRQAFPVQRDVVEGAPLLPRVPGLVRSNYSRADLDRAVTPIARLADGLEGRTRALLERRAD